MKTLINKINIDEKILNKNEELKYIPNKFNLNIDFFEQNNLNYNTLNLPQNTTISQNILNEKKNDYMKNFDIHENFFDDDIHNISFEGINSKYNNSTNVYQDKNKNLEKKKQKKNI